MNIARGIEMFEISSLIMGAQSVIHPTLIMDDDGTTILVDTGFPGQLPLIRKAFEDAGASFEKLSVVILTHQDIDHIGNLAAIREELPHIRVFAHGEEKPYIQGDKVPVKVARLEAQLPGLPEETKTIYHKLKVGFESCRTPVDRMLSDGEEFPYYGGITIIHTPGHTPGHICLYQQKSRTLIAGDALMVEDGTLVKTMVFTNDDPDLYAQSLKKLAAYDIEAVVCYHGGLYRGDAGKRIAELVEDV